MLKNVWRLTSGRVAIVLLLLIRFRPQGLMGTL